MRFDPKWPVSPKQLRSFGRMHTACYLGLATDLLNTNRFADATKEAVKALKLLRRLEKLR